VWSCLRQVLWAATGNGLMGPSTVLSLSSPGYALCWEDGVYAGKAVDRRLRDGYGVECAVRMEGESDNGKISILTARYREIEVSLMDIVVMSLKTSGKVHSLSFRKLTSPPSDFPTHPGTKLKCPQYRVQQNLQSTMEVHLRPLHLRAYVHPERSKSCRWVEPYLSLQLKLVIAGDPAVLLTRHRESCSNAQSGDPK
jgi:hypothetical protein